MQTPLKVIQISDIHLFTQPEGELLGVRTQESFKAVLDLIQKEEKQIDFILLSGDLSQDGSENSYLKLADMLNVFKMPIYFVPGNHDNVDSMKKIFPRQNILTDKHMVIGNWQFILLNSQIPGSVEGFLDEAQLNHLRTCLEKNPNQRAITLFHHQPIPVDCVWLDNLGLKNADEFWKIISQYPSMDTVLFGHVHQVTENKVNHIKCYSAPSTCFQFHREQDHFGLENLPPGYRWIHLYNDGHIETGVKRTEKYIGTFQPGAKGY